jgi:hypothetical protein
LHEEDDVMTPANMRLARAELETIAAALRVHELAQLLALGRRLLDQGEEGQDLFDRWSRENLR